MTGAVAAQGHATSAVAVEDRVVVAVDRRFELFSILGRLAGAPEYLAASTPYASAADAWFAPHAGDAAVLILRDLRAEHGVSHDAALTLAAQLDEELEMVRLLSPWPDGLDRRWEGVDVEAFLDEVRAFATASRFDEFVASEAEYVSDVEDEFNAFITERPIVTWFEEHLGAREDTEYQVVPGLLTGDMSYGIHAGADEIFAVVGLEVPDADGLPTLGLLSEELLVHELAHSYVNPMVHARLTAFAGSSPMLDVAAAAMESQHYTTLEIVIDESIVRALTILYLRDDVSAAAADASLAGQLQLGFSWMPALVDALDANRSADGAWTDDELIATSASALGLGSTTKSDSGFRPRPVRELRRGRRGRWARPVPHRVGRLGADPRHRGRESGRSGLGLSIVAAVALSHRGTVREERSPSGGARFTTRFPASRHV